MAQVRPAADLPVVHEAHFAHQRLEALGLAHWRICWSPNETSEAPEIGESSFGHALIEIESPVGSPGVEVARVECRQENFFDIQQLAVTSIIASRAGRWHRAQKDAVR
jgi:hypothetical protein